MSSIENLIGLACQVNDLVAQATRPAIASQGLTSASFDLLSAIWAADGRETQAEIGKRLGLSRATISEAVTSLANSGYVIRRPSELDSRAVNLELTPEGHKKVKAVLTEMRRIQTEIEGKISAKEAEAASKTLRKVLNSLKVEVF
ncbi:MAG: winged helix-turn-helix transcriptional regulator [Armatimonadetes bacterium]|nr:winged helix-turn-helix transcriptional regulator [Armatimonadota bacterium]